MLEIFEATLSFVPSSTSQKQMIDISLYDHVKITAAIGSCIYEYMKENNETEAVSVNSTAGVFVSLMSALIVSMVTLF